MKKIIMFSLLIGVVLIACTKEFDQGKTNSKELQGIALKENAPSEGISANLNRGPKHKRRRDGLPCNCYRCFGICFAAADDGDDMNVIMEPIGRTAAKLYILSIPDDDVLVDPILYVDENIQINNGVNFNKILSGQYPYNGSSGNITYKGKEYFYHGTVNVNYE